MGVGYGGTAGSVHRLIGVVGVVGTVTSLTSSILRLEVIGVVGAVASLISSVLSGLRMSKHISESDVLHDRGECERGVFTDAKED